MSVTIVEQGGPMRLRPLSDQRVAALLAVDEGQPLPDAVVDYILALERAYHSLEARHNREFLESTWDARRVAVATREGRS